MTMVRVYTNQDTTEMYFHLFTKVFECISVATGSPCYWQHLNKSGWYAVIMDMDSKQMSGK